MSTDEAATGVALIAVDPAGRNQIAVAPGANHRLSPERVAPHADAIAWADVVLLQLETPIDTVRWALHEARRVGKVTILNPAPARVLPLPPDILPLVHYVTPNETEAGLILGREVSGVTGAQAAGRALADMGVRASVVTVGAEGAVLVGPASSIHVPGFPVSPLDTVGAGDAFNGGLATALAAGMPVEDGLVLANAAGALTCTRHGAMDALPARDDVRALLASSGRERGDW
jgi:ribokinase